MTAKEKAEELIEKHLKSYDIEEIAIKSAIITVDEILEIEYWQYMESGGKQEQIYWQEVKQEIEKLW